MKHKNRCRKSIERKRALTSPTFDQLVASNRYKPKVYSGSMYSRIGNARDKSPFAVTHIGIKAAGQGDKASIEHMKHRNDRLRGVTNRFAKRDAKQVRDE